MRGYVIMAQNTSTVNYVECAEVLAMSIRQNNPNANITIITEDKLPYGDLAPDSDWKLINDWQVYEASPYDETIKLEADMLVSNNIDYLFDALSIKDVCICTTIRDYKGNISDSRAYRKFIDNNNLPDVYNAITYFKKSTFAKTFFETVRCIFENWNDIRPNFKCNVDEPISTDWAYSIASHVLGVENTTIPTIIRDFSMVHMKHLIVNTITEDWTKELVYEIGNPIRIQTIPQTYPFHYHIKPFSKKIIEYYGRI